MKYRNKGYTTEQLLEMSAKIERNPENWNRPGSISIYTKAATKQLDEIGLAIVDNTIAKQKASGTFVPADGYSGRQTNRR
jgi:hypothetical protein